MWRRFVNYLQSKGVDYKKQRYLEQLDELDLDAVAIDNLPTLLITFWKNFDVKLLQTIPARDYMYIQMTLNHDNISELIFALQDFTNAIAQNDYSVIELAARERFKQKRTTDLDAYMSGLNGEVLDGKDVFAQLKANICRHGEILDTVEEKAYRRYLYRFYNDLNVLTHTLVNNIKG